MADNDLVEAVARELAMHGVGRDSDERTAARAALAAADRAAWQPIETAPRDGRNVDLWVPGENQRYTDAYWASSSDGEVGFWMKAGGDIIESHKPTHWMPPPQPPEQDDG